jgi:FecR protein
MKRASHLSWFFAILLSVLLVFPGPLAAQARSAGQIARLVGAVNLQHGPRVVLASSGAKVFWGDLVTTLQDGRARIALDDGSILNVGSNSNLKIIQHDAVNQRTQLQLAYGRLRFSAVRLAHRGSSFQVRTPTAVAGVVGTSADVSFVNEITSLSVDEGSVNLCNFQVPPQCVTVTAGFTATIRGNQAPSQPTPTSPGTATENVQSTSVTGGGGAGGGAGAGAGVGAAAASHVSVIVAVVGALGAVGGIAGVTVGSNGKKCGCTTVLPGGGIANRHSGHP